LLLLVLPLDSHIFHTILLINLIASKQTTMPVPIVTLEQQFSTLSANDSNKTTKEILMNESAASTTTGAVLVTPTKEELRNTSETDSLTSEESTETPFKFLVEKTDHKLQEERGELELDPLLKENPHRFVIFPIQDNDVGVYGIARMSVHVVLSQQSFCPASYSSGVCTKRQKPPSGHRKRLTWVRT
jgi:hypothetical protein